MRFVPLKAEAQLDVQALHRARERLVAERTALINQMRALLLERGTVLPLGRRAVAAWVDAPREAGEADCLSPRIRLLVTDMREEWAGLDRRIAVFEEEFAASARGDEAARRLATVPGIGPINATALVAAVGDASAFAKARDLAAWLGLVPKQATTGGKPKLLGITKRGSRYLRKNLIHGARAVMPRLAATSTRLGRWLRDLLARAHKNTVVVALANKLARIVWAVLARGRSYEAAAAAG
jgi:transposase